MPDTPNIVLVHGAWADGSCWGGVIERLQAKGYNVVAPQFPLTRSPTTSRACARCSPARAARRSSPATPTAGRS